MKLYVIRETSGHNTITRNGQTIAIGLGEPFNQIELATLVCDTPTTYLCLTDSIVYTVDGASPAVTVSVPDTVVVPVVEEAPAEAVVPSSVEPGSEASQA
jgi:hypothetical protein